MDFPWWQQINDISLAQGDLLPNCVFPGYSSYATELRSGADLELNLKQADLIVITQTCDLDNSKVPFVSLCLIHRMEEFKHLHPNKSDNQNLEFIRQGRTERMHLLASTEDPLNNQEAFVVDFNQIVSMPVRAVQDHCNKLGSRWRLQSPYLEHFSQALARFFMRVGLPSSIPRFKK